jgi:Kef-type K+ transport system membrane component KefB
VLTKTKHAMTKVWIFSDLEEPSAALPIFLLQVAVTLVITRTCSRILVYLKQPTVIGEMIGGVLLGPSALGRIAAYHDFLWPTWSLSTFTVAANIGLILFMFSLGIELDTRVLKKTYRKAVPISLAGIAVPFGIGLAISAWMYDYNINTATNTSHPAFMLFMGVSLSFTAFPVLASILQSANLIETPLAVLALAAASFGDVLGWCVLATCSSFAANQPSDGGYVFLAAFLLTFTVIAVLRPIFQYALIIVTDGGRIQSSQFTDLLYITLAIVCSFAFEVIGVHAFFGSFLAGVIVPKGDHPAAGSAKNLPERLELTSRGFLLPLFFASSGIKTDVGSLTEGDDWMRFIVILVISVLVKFIPSCLVTKVVTKKDWRFAVTVGVLMNTRGLVELIALNVGLQTGVLGVKLFTILVLMAILTTCMTSPLLHYIYTTRVLVKPKFQEENIDATSLHPDRATHDNGHKHALENSVL